MSTKPIHPFAEVFPPMTPAEFAGLRRSIRSRVDADLKPLINDIVLLDGKVLDGRHRDRACDEEKVAASYVEFDAERLGDPVKWVLSQGVHRNLTESQKAAAAVAIAEAMARPAKGHANLKQRRAGNLSGPDGAEAVDGEARELAGGMLGVSGRYVGEAMALKKVDPGLFAKVFSGELTIPKAKREVHKTTKRKTLAAVAAQLPSGTDTRAWFTLEAGDCLKVMPKWNRRFARLVVADPPYNEGIDYGDGAKADALPREKYMKWCATWMIEAAGLLTADGAMWVIINDEWAAELRMLLREIGLFPRAWVKWYETFGVNCANNFNRTSRHLHYFTKSETDFVFNADAVTRKSARQEVYGDRRANPAGKIWDDVWQIPRIVGTSDERLPDFKTQLPEDLIRPIVAACTEPGDTVVDPFNGSGTTGAVSLRLGRRYFGIDKNAGRVKQADQRLRGVLAEQLAPKAGKRVSAANNVDTIIAAYVGGDWRTLHRHLIAIDYRGYATKSRAVDALAPGRETENKRIRLEGDLALLRGEFVADHGKRRKS